MLLEQAPNRSLQDKEIVSKNEATTSFPDSVCQNTDTSQSSANWRSGDSMAKKLFVFSAKTSVSLRLYLSSIIDYLEKEPVSKNLARNLSYTLGQRRTHFAHRVAVLAHSSGALRESLLSLPENINHDRILEPVVAFIFTGQGAQVHQMALELHQYETFAAAIRDADCILRKLGASWSLMEELNKAEDESRIHDAEISQPACTAVQIGLVLLLQAWGVTPTVVTGHSSGEIAAAFAAGFVSFEAAMAISFFRGVAARTASRIHVGQGAMLAVGIGADEAAKLVEGEEGYSTLAATNSPGSVTISGDKSAIKNIEQKAHDRGLFVRRLKVDVAYHSHHMDQAASPYLAAIQPFCSGNNLPTAAFISSVSGRREHSDAVDAQYWVRNLLSPVKYMEAVESLFPPHGENSELATDQEWPNILVEIGPHPALKNATKQTLERIYARDGGRRIGRVAYLPSLVRFHDATDDMLELAGRLFCLGVDIGFADVNKTDSANSHVVKNLPPYQWDKGVSYMHRNRMTLEKLHRGRSYDPLLGWRSPYSEGNEISFRNVFTLDDLPYLRDHRVAGEVLLPFTAFISLAIKALMADSSVAIASVSITEFHVGKTLKIEEGQHVDITTKLRPQKLGTEAFSSSTLAFEIWSWSEAAGWTAHSHGLLKAEDAGFLLESPNVGVAVELLDSGLATLEECNAQQEYTKFKKDGVHLGPSFCTMTKLWKAPGIAVHEFELHQSSLPAVAHSSPVTVKSFSPATLDTMMHSIGAIQEIDGPRPLLVPTYTRQWRLLANVSISVDAKFCVVSKLGARDEKSGSLKASFVVFLVAGGKKVPVAEIETLVMSSLAQPDEAKLAESLPDTYVPKQVPYVELLDGQSLSKMLCDTSIPQCELQNRRRMNDAGFIFLRRMIQQVQNESLFHLPPHLSKFLKWSKCLVAKCRATSDYTAECDLIAEVNGYNAAGKLLCSVGRQLPAVLRGDVDPLNIMLEDGLLWRNYEEDTATVRGSRGLAKYIRCLADVYPDMNILEIGAGTASITEHVLEAINEAIGGGTSFFQYTFTDISTGFFEKARSKLSRWTGRVAYKKLDISQDPAAQGFVLASYDLVIAANVVHATADVVATIRNVNALLKPGGKLVLLEAVQNNLPLALPFAVLPGWWLSKDKYRSKQGPLLSEDLWNSVLIDGGFSGVEGTLQDYASAEHFVAVMWSTVLPSSGKQERPDTEGARIAICPCSQEADGGGTFSRIVFDKVGSDAHIQPVPDLETDTAQFYIFLDSPQSSILSDLSPALFYRLKQTLLDAAGVLWVLPENATPDAAMIKGLFRTLRLESSARALLILENTPLTDRGATIIAQLSHWLQRKDSVAYKEQDFSVIDGMVHVLRMRPSETAKNTFAIEAGLIVKQEQSLWQDCETLRMTVDSIGSLESIYFEQVDACTRELNQDEIVVRVEAIGMNFRDLLLVLGSLPWQPPGFEGAGIVERIGSQVTDLQVGHRVFYSMSQGGWTNYARMPSWRAQRIPDALSMADAATMPVAYSTAIMCLVHIGRLQKDETVLIHAASGAVGQACVMIAQHLGAKIFVTAGTLEKRAFLAETFGIPSTRIFSSRTPKFRDAILEATDGNGVDVIVNSLSGNLLQQTWSLIAENGRFVEIGKKDLLRNNYLPLRPFDRNVTFTGFDLLKSCRKPEVMRNLLINILDLFKRDMIRPIQPVTLLPISQVVSGLRKLQGGHAVGKIVITVSQDDKVVARCPSRLHAPSGSLLHSDATYLITGGTGGIGRGLAAWMIKEGAKNVVLLSRSGPSNPEIAGLLTQFEGTSVCLRAIGCDAGSRGSLVHALEAIDDLPRVRGVVHAALYLKVRSRGQRCLYIF